MWLRQLWNDSGGYDSSTCVPSLSLHCQPCQVSIATPVHLTSRLPCPSRNPQQTQQCGKVLSLFSLVFQGELGKQEATSTTSAENFCEEMQGWFSICRDLGLLPKIRPKTISNGQANVHKGFKNKTKQKNLDSPFCFCLAGQSVTE